MPPQTRGAAKRARFMNAREQALGIVVSSGFLHWYEAVKLGETCKEMQYEWQEKKDHICEPLLASLKELKVSTNICQRLRCQKVAFPASERQCQCSAEEQDTPLAHLDPRFNEEIYLQLSTWQKCKAMAEFTSLLVSNFQSNLENTTQSSVPFPFNFDGNYPAIQFLAQEKPRRFAFMMKLAFAICGQFVLYEGSGRIAVFNQAFAENTGFVPAHGLGEDLATSLNRLLPWTNHILELTIRGVHDLVPDRSGYKKAWEMLGPVLARKLGFFSTFVKENGAVLLPGDMEPISNEEEERIRDMMLGARLMRV